MHVRILVMLAFLVASSFAHAEEIEDLFFKQSVKKVAAERAAKRKTSRSVKRRPPKVEEAPSRTPPAPTEHGISEFGMERNFGFHSAPVFTLIVKSDCTFRFEGRGKVQHLGTWTGTIERRAFDDLAKFIRESDYMGLSDRYWADATDLCAVYTTVVQDGKRHVIQDCYITAPPKLKEIEERIYALLKNAKWDEQKQASETPEKNADSLDQPQPPAN
jgi:hypothetical protein